MMTFSGHTGVTQSTKPPFKLSVCVDMTRETCLCVLHRVFQADLQVRLQQWGAEKCIGDVFVKFCSKLKVYTNYLNNYTTAIHTIDKVKPVSF